MLQFVALNDKKYGFIICEKGILLWNENTYLIELNKIKNK